MVCTLSDMIASWYISSACLWSSECIMILSSISIDVTVDWAQTLEFSAVFLRLLKMLCCRFNLEDASVAAGWQQELLGASHPPETEQYGISSFVYQVSKPFHPKRLWLLLENKQLPQVLRSKGFFWIASQPSLLWEWSTAGSLWTKQICLAMEQCEYSQVVDLTVCLHCCIKHALLWKLSATSAINFTTHVCCCCFNLFFHQCCQAICRRWLHLRNIWAPNNNIQSVGCAEDSVHWFASRNKNYPDPVR